MIKANDLVEVRPTIKYQNANEVTLITVKEAIEECANRKGIYLAFKNDKVMSGRSKYDGVEECLVIYHPEHEKDYAKLCIRIKRTGIYTFLSIHEFGRSKLNLQNKMVNGATIGAVVGAGLSGGLLGGAMGLAAGSILKKKFLPDQLKLEDENNYYDCLMDIIDEVMS